jgi:uncharacterized membrane protein required for colicin V production
MTTFDLLVAAVLVLSTAFAAIRGGLREVGALAVLAAAAAMALLLAKPLLNALGAKPTFLALAAVVGAVGFVGFVGFYVLLHFGLKRLRIKGAGLRADRVAGGVFGFLRGLALVGLGFLAYGYSFAEDRRPPSVRNALTLPIAEATADFFASFAPESNRLQPAAAKKPETNAAVEGYPRAERSALAEIVTTATTSPDRPDPIAEALKAGDPE